MKNGKATMLSFVGKLKNNFQFNQLLGIHHRIDAWVSGGRKPGQVLETITSSAFSLGNGLYPPNQ